MNQLQTLVKGKRVAVVGNAPTLKNSGLGDKINSYDYVIRFNRFVIDGFEQDVGTKRNILSLSVEYLPSIPNAEILSSDQTELVIAFAPKDYHFDVLAKYTKAKIKCPIAYIDNSICCNLTNEIHASPTSGMLVLDYLVNNCDCSEIFVAGFSFKRLAEDHYFQHDETSRFLYDWHSPYLEGLYFCRKLLQSKVVTYDSHIEKTINQNNYCNEYTNLVNRNFKDYSVPHQDLYESIANDVNGLKVLEVGAGIGFGIKKLIEAGAVVTAIEPELEAYNYVKNQELACTLLHTSLENFKTSETFDLGVCIEVLEHLSMADVHKFLTAASTKCKKLILSTPNRSLSDHGRFLPEELTHVLYCAGFIITNLTKLPASTNGLPHLIATAYSEVLNNADEVYTSLRKDNKAVKRSEITLAPLVNFFNVKAIADFGCGDSNWLAAAENLGVEILTGYERSRDIVVPLVHPKHIKIQDIGFPIEFKDRCDMALCLATADKLYEGRANILIDNLTACADVVVFSAATPDDTGSGLNNKQPHSYWHKKFADRGYIPFDNIRSYMNQQSCLEWWYRKNIYVYVKA